MNTEQLKTDKPAIEILRHHYIHDKGLNNPDYVLNAMIDFASQESKRAVEKDRESRWISVKERLPDKNGFVAVHKHNGMVFGCFFDFDLKFMYSDVDQTEQITHWQPLPEPPKQLTP